MPKLKVGLIGCGAISRIYLENCRMFSSFEVVACADLDVDRAREKAKEFHVPQACTVEEVLADPAIDIILNLTVPVAHAQVCLAALEAGKHVYVEKPLSVTVEDGLKIMELAASSGMRVGVAPDTFLGGGLQTCIGLVRDGWIGRPVAASAFFMSNGVESWHPNPDFYYQPGGGPLFDMGPYYLTALVALIGPVKRVTGSAVKSFDKRFTPDGRGIPVHVPTHVAGVLDFENGVVGSMVTSFDSWGSNLPRIEIYGEKGTLSVPDPNTFTGPVSFRGQGEKSFREVPLTHGYTGNSRGIGLADMAEAIVDERAHRANGYLAMHILEIMHGLHAASERGQHYTLETTAVRPEPLAVDHRF